MATKTPVSQLQELCVKRGLVPVYELERQGMFFTVRVAVGEHTTMGRGKSKKLAKQTAARELLMAMGVTPCALPTPEVSSDAINRLSSLAHYELFDELGPPHARIFVMGVNVGKRSAIGSGSSKKIAKRKAAENLLLKN